MSLSSFSIYGGWNKSIYLSPGSLTVIASEILTQTKAPSTTSKKINNILYLPGIPPSQTRLWFCPNSSQIGDTGHTDIGDVDYNYWGWWGGGVLRGSRQGTELPGKLCKLLKVLSIAEERFWGININITVGKAVIIKTFSLATNPNKNHHQTQQPSIYTPLPHPLFSPFLFPLFSLSFPMISPLPFPL